MGNLVCRLAVGGASCNPALLVDGRYFCNHIQFLGNAVNGFVRGGVKALCPWEPGPGLSMQLCLNSQITLRSQAPGTLCVIQAEVKK